MTKTSSSNASDSDHEKYAADNERILKLSVVIATYNGASYIGRCLESFTHQSLDSCLYEVIMVDNNSTDTTAGIVSEYVNRCDNFISVQELRQGVGYARNAGIDKARGEYVCFIDDDAYADPQWLEGVLNAFETVKPAPAVVGGRYLPYYVEGKPYWFTDELEIRTQGNHARFLKEHGFIKDCECFFGFPESNYCIRKSVVDEVGGFSVEIGPKAETMQFGEGIELSTRVAKKYPLFWYDPQLIVYHLVPARNMSIKYILSRRYEMAYSFQQHQMRLLCTAKLMVALTLCAIRVGINLLLSVVGVRWFTRHAVKDWLSHMRPLVRCLARCSCIMKTWCGRA